MHGLMPARRGIVLLLIHFIIIGRVSVKGFFINSDDDFEDQSSSYSVENINPEKLSNALKALMSLNDGELGLLLSGAAIPDVASQINPMTSFLLANSHQKLETIQDAIARYPDSQLPGDLAIAKRRKLSENRLQPDSLLAALAQLASQVKEQQRAEIPVPQQGPIFTSNSSREIAKSRRRRSHRNGSKAGYYTAQQHFHPEFFYRPEKCPPGHGEAQRYFCPTPDADNRWVCIEPHDLCDDRPDCPNSEDEYPAACLFYLPVREELDIIITELTSPYQRYRIKNSS